MQTHDVKIEKIKLQSNNELSSHLYRICNFCDKVVRVGEKNSQSCENIGGTKFYCPFCLRHNLHHRSSRNVLAFSYRGIIGYYYHKLYDHTPRKLWLSEIEELITKHATIGLQNPVLCYDPYTYLWFVNFNLIGEANRKAPSEEVFRVIRSIYDAFEVKKHLNDHASDCLWEKFNKAIKLFHQKRKRPVNRKMLIPTFDGCVGHEQSSFFDITREFDKSDMILK